MRRIPEWLERRRFHKRLRREMRDANVTVSASLTEYHETHSEGLNLQVDVEFSLAGETITGEGQDSAGYRPK